MVLGKNREWRPLILSRKCTLSCTPAARGSVSSHVPLARDARWRACSHTTYLPSWNLSRCSLSHNHMISHTLVVACEPCDITRVPYCHKIVISHTNWILTPLDLTHSALEILPNNAFWSFTTKPFTGHTLRGLLIQMQNTSLQSSGMRRKQNFELWGLKVTQQSWLLLFAFSPPFFFRFPCLIFFLLLGI